MRRIRITRTITVAVSTFIVPDGAPDGFELFWDHTFRRGELHDVGECVESEAGGASFLLELLNLGGYADLPQECFLWEDSLRYSFDPSRPSAN